MNKQQQRELKTIIHHRIDYLLTLVDENAANAGNHSNDDAENMFRVVASPVEAHVIEQSEIEITQLTHALKRLDDDTAGYCAGCGCEIPFARLKSVPVTGYCVSCLEQQQKE